jgi:tetratricopeptide (TPR) repeat protein
MIFKLKQYFKYFAVFFIPALFLTGCGAWENFTTYFNLYYNTVDAFEEAEKSIYEQKRDLFSTEELQIPGTTTQQLTKVIEKASKILQFHSNSSFIDDALLMLGKSFYYQKNYQKALRKFQELIATQSESDLSLETYLWIGKSYMRLKDFQNGLSTLDAVIDTAVTEEEEGILKEAYVEEIVYHLGNKNYANAITISKQFIETTSDDEVIAEVYYELGKLYLEIDDIANSIAALSRVNDYSPSYNVEVGANIALAKALRESGKKEEALEILEEMGDENKYSDNYSEIDLETGITLTELGRDDEALELFTYVDTTYSTTPFSGIARYKKGELYELKIKNFDSAAVFYQKSVGGSTPPEIIVAANSKIQKFKKYQTIAADLYEQEKQLTYILHPEIFVRDSVEYYADSIETAEMELAEAQFNAFNIPDTTKSDTTKSDTTSTDSTKVPNNQVPGNNQQLADNQPPGNPPVNTQNNKNQPGGRNVKNDPRNPGGNIPGQPNDQQEQEKKKPPVRPVISADSVNSLLAKTKFELANLFFSEFNLPDSAYFYYNDIAVNHNDSTYLGRALFGIGSFYETKGDTVKSDSIYNIIYDRFKTEKIVNSAAMKLKKPVIDLDFDPAKNLYMEAEKMMLEKNYNESLSKFIDISNTYPQSNYASKALYAGGWILENELKMLDSAASIYDSIAVRYPQSAYTARVKPKLTTYKVDREGKAKALKDSLNALQKVKIDSLKGDSTGIAPDSLQQDLLIQPDSLLQKQDSIRAEAIQTPINKNDLKKTKPQVNNTTVKTDSLKQAHETVVDSLRREPDVLPDSAKPVPIKPDSLKGGKIEP